MASGNRAAWWLTTKPRIEALLMLLDGKHTGNLVVRP